MRDLLHYTKYWSRPYLNTINLYLLYPRTPHLYYRCHTTGIPPRRLTHLPLNFSTMRGGGDRAGRPSRMSSFEAMKSVYLSDPITDHGPGMSYLFEAVEFRFGCWRREILRIVRISTGERLCYCFPSLPPPCSLYPPSLSGLRTEPRLLFCLLKMRSKSTLFRRYLLGYLWQTKLGSLGNSIGLWTAS